MITNTERHGMNAPPVDLLANQLALFLHARAIYTQAEPLYRRALAIDEAILGPNHPKVATELNNLAALLKDTNRLAEAEPLSRRHLEIFLQFTAATDHEHPHLSTAIAKRWAAARCKSVPKLRSWEAEQQQTTQNIGQKIT